MGPDQCSARANEVRQWLCQMLAGKFAYPATHHQGLSLAEIGCILKHGYDKLELEVLTLPLFRPGASSSSQLEQ